MHKAFSTYPTLTIQTHFTGSIFVTLRIRDLITPCYPGRSSCFCPCCRRPLSPTLTPGKSFKSHSSSIHVVIPAMITVNNDPGFIPHRTCAFSSLWGRASWEICKYLPSHLVRMLCQQAGRFSKKTYLPLFRKDPRLDVGFGLEAGKGKNKGASHFCFRQMFSQTLETVFLSFFSETHGHFSPGRM